MEKGFEILTVLLFVGWRIYWRITEKKADREKPKTKEKPPLFSRERISSYGVWLFGILFMLQALFGTTRFPLPGNSWIPLIGFILVVAGLGLCIVARRQLSTNWANAWEYQIKKKQELVTHGVYSSIRHPIYTGIIVAMIGAELVVQSVLFVVFIAFFAGAYWQAKKEEVILEKHFGKEYTAYKKRTKMLIPFIV